MTNVRAFPADRCGADVRRLADNLNRYHGKAADRYWKLEMRALAARLTACGFGDEEISEQAIRLTNAVQAELCMMWATAKS